MAKTILQDARYAKFVEEYAFNLDRFFIEVLGITPSWQQLQILESVQMPGSRTSVASGHSCFGVDMRVRLAGGFGKSVQNLKIGDKLAGRFPGEVREVLALRRGRDEMFRFHYSDGTFHDFNHEHMLVVYGAVDDEPRRVMVRDWLTLPAVDRPTTCERDGSSICIAGYESLGERDYYGFILDGDGLFRLEDGTLVSNTGKSASFGGIVLWHLLCYYSNRERKGSITMITANDISQVRNIVWKEIQAMYDHMSTGPHAWICPYVKIMERRIFMVGHKSTWFVFAKTAPAGKPNGLAGQHGDWLMIIADEAASLPDANFTTMTGALSHANNRMLLASQPIRNIGFFYETHHKLSKDSIGPDGLPGVWNNIVLNSEESPFASDVFLAEKAAEYGGRDTEEYGIRVRGHFPESSSKYLIARKLVEAAFDRPCVIDDDEPYGWLILNDVAAGEYRDKSVVMIAKVAGSSDYGPDARRMHIMRIPVHSASIQPDELAGTVFQESFAYENCTIVVDSMGMGILFVKALEKMEGLEAPVFRLIWGVPCFLKRHKERFYNRRAQAYVALRDAFRDGRISIEDHSYKQDMLNQGSRIPYGYDPKGRYQIAAKGSKEWEGLPSPDLLDATAFGFMGETTYIPITSRSEAVQGEKKKEFDALAEAMADL